MATAKPITNNMKGASWKVVASLGFACTSGMVRYLTKGSADLPALPVNQIIFLENLFGLVLLTPLIFSLGWKNLKPNHPRIHLVRVIFASSGVMCWYFSLKYMQIGHAAALAFMGPIFTIMGAALILKERLTPFKNMAILTSVMGAFMIIRPDLALFGSKDSLIGEVGPWVFLPIVSAFLIACSKLTSRKLASSGESPKVMTLYLMLALVPVTFIPALFTWAPVTGLHLVLCCILGASVVLAHYGTSAAYTYAGVNFLTPFSFFRLILGIGVGFTLFGEIPTRVGVWVGIGTIVFSIILLSLGSKKGARQTT